MVPKQHGCRTLVVLQERSIFYNSCQRLTTKTYHAQILHFQKLTEDSGRNGLNHLAIILPDKSTAQALDEMKTGHQHGVGEYDLVPMRPFDNNFRVWLQVKDECHRLDPCSCCSRLFRTRHIIPSSKT